MSQEQSQQQVEMMIEAIKERLKMATAQAMQASAFSIEQYEDIKDIYELVMSKSNYSISEMEAIVSELGKLRRV